MRSAPTDAERVLWRLLRAKRFAGFKFRRQAPLGRYIVDFVCLEKRLIIEADGGQHNGSAQDAERDAWLTAQGFHVVRFWNHEVLCQSQMVEDTIWRDLYRREMGVAFRPERCAPSPLPSPARGEGDFDIGPLSSLSAPGGKDDKEALLPPPPSPLAGEGKGEGVRRTSRARPTPQSPPTPRRATP
jgi:very-short-patch-repair endonuclease